MTREIVLWRIATDAPDFAADDLSGKGAEQSGGRWNRVGTPLVYASTSRALACLETVVHLAKRPLPLNRDLVRIMVPTVVWRAAAEVDPAALIGWDAEPASNASLDWGARWARSATTALAEVPSIVVPEELNVLINPLHADAARLTAAKVRKWTYDSRLGAAA